MTAIGRARTVPVPGRDKAQVGNAVYVSGPIGAAMVAFEELQADPDAEANAYRRPYPRVSEGIEIAARASAMMDVSDGLLLDAWRMAQASRVCLSLETATIPLGAPEDRLQDAIRWGDDYELLFTASEDFETEWPLFRIGEVVEGEGLLVDGIALTSPDGLGYRHG